MKILFAVSIIILASIGLYVAYSWFGLAVVGCISLFIYVNRSDFRLFKRKPTSKPNFRVIRGGKK